MDWKLKCSSRCFTGHIKDLDILPKRSILVVIPTQFSLPVNFQHNLNLQEMAMRMGHPKVLERETSKGPMFPSGGFFILEVIL
jgi:hypothetical protein